MISHPAVRYWSRREMLLDEREGWDALAASGEEELGLEGERGERDGEDLDGEGEIVVAEERRVEKRGETDDFVEFVALAGAKKDEETIRQKTCRSRRGESSSDATGVRRRIRSPLEPTQNDKESEWHWFRRLRCLRDDVRIELRTWP